MVARGRETERPWQSGENLLARPVLAPLPKGAMSSPSPRIADVAARLRQAGCVFAEDEARVLIASAGSPTELETSIERRAAGVPLEQVVGWAAFCGLRIAVDPSVFVPRRRTELLVREAIALATPGAIVVDLCCGSGAVGAALLAACEGLELHLVDIDPRAVVCARRNVAGAGRVHEGDLYEPLPATLRGQVDLVVANAPYVPSEELGLLPPEARLHEPRVALDGGADGLEIQRRAIAEAPGWLAPGGRLLVETSEHQAPRTVEAFVDSGLEPVVRRSEELSATVVIGRAASATPG